MVRLTIDGFPVEVEKGTTILHAAEKLGIKIPTLCYIEDLLPDGSCRMCVVEVKNNGRTKIDTAVKLFRLISLLPYLKESGLFENLF